MNKIELITFKADYYGFYENKHRYSFEYSKTNQITYTLTKFNFPCENRLSDNIQSLKISMRIEFFFNE